MTKPTSTKNLFSEKNDFSLVLGGPLYQLFRRSHLAGDALEMVHRRILILVIMTWVPLLILSLLGGRAWSGAALPFLYDVDTHCRLLVALPLVALPLLVFAELVVHQRMRQVVRQFLDRDLIPESQRERFFHIVESAGRLRNSLTAEVLLIVFVYVVGVHYIYQNVTVDSASTWYARDGRPRFPL